MLSHGAGVSASLDAPPSPDSSRWVALLTLVSSATHRSAELPISKPQNPGAGEPVSRAGVGQSLAWTVSYVPYRPKT